jgi:hypothetical protein
MSPQQIENTPTEAKEKSDNKIILVWHNGIIRVDIDESTFEWGVGHHAAYPGPASSGRHH